MATVHFTSDVVQRCEIPEPTVDEKPEVKMAAIARWLHTSRSFPNLLGVEPTPVLYVDTGDHKLKRSPDMIFFKLSNGNCGGIEV